MSDRKTIAAISLDARHLYLRLARATIGETLTYDDLSKAIGRDVSPGKPGYGALTTARRRAHLDGGIVFDAVTKIGLKRLSDTEIVGSGQHAIDRVRRAARRGAVKLLSVGDFEALPNELKHKHNAYTSLLGAITQITQGRRVEELERHVGNAQATLPLWKTLEIFKG